MSWVFDIAPDLVSIIIEAVATGKSGKLDLPMRIDGLQVNCNKVPIARLVWEQEHGDHRIVALACHAGRHGVQDPRWVELGEKIKALGCEPVVKCPLCNDTAWIPAHSETARKQAILSGSLKVYRGVVYQPSEAFSSFVEKTAQFTLASLFT